MVGLERMLDYIIAVLINNIEVRCTVALYIYKTDLPRYGHARALACMHLELFHNLELSLQNSIYVVVEITCFETSLICTSPEADLGWCLHGVPRHHPM